MMKWHSLYQSVSHSVTPAVPEYWLPLRPAPLHTAVALPLGNCLSPFPPSPAFISTLQAVPFQSIISSPPTLALGKGGKPAKRCGIFLSSLAPMAIRHKALCPFLHAFSPSPKAFFSYIPMKRHSSLLSKPFPLFLVLSLVRLSSSVFFSTLECHR